METVMPNSVASRWTPLFADVNPGGISKKIGVQTFAIILGLMFQKPCRLEMVEMIFLC
ncbi:hypothetical protein [Chryseobacterium wanjuense]